MTGTTPPDRPFMEASVPSADAPPSAGHAPLQSASKRKLAYDTDSAPTYGDNQMPITILFTGMLQNLLTDLCCSVCGSNNLKLVTNADQDRGLAVCLGVVCSFCGNACSTTYTSPKLASGAFEVNRRFVASGLNLGLGCSQLQKPSEGMSMKSLLEGPPRPPGESHPKIIPRQSWIRRQRLYTRCTKRPCMRTTEMIFWTSVYCMMARGKRGGTHPKSASDAS